MAKDKTIRIESYDWARLKLLQEEYNKAFPPKNGEAPMSLAVTIRYVLNGYERGMYPIKRGMFDDEERDTDAE